MWENFWSHFDDLSFCQSCLVRSDIDVTFADHVSLKISNRIIDFCNLWLSDNEEVVVRLAWCFVMLDKLWEARNNRFWRGQEACPSQVVNSIKSSMRYYTNRVNSQKTQATNPLIHLNKAHNVLPLSSIGHWNAICCWISNFDTSRVLYFCVFINGQ